MIRKPYMSGEELADADFLAFEPHEVIGVYSRIEESCFSFGRTMFKLYGKGSRNELPARVWTKSMHWHYELIGYLDLSTGELCDEPPKRTW